MVLYQPFSNNNDLRLIYPFGINGLALEIRKGDYLVKDIKDYWLYKVYSEKFFKNKYEEIPPNLNERFENYEGENKQGEYFND